ncbi:MAG TPA: DUF4159 domain-containing protein [Terriglobia bacterium]|nr:DUF4159 domain-containing protein [Terriglobia bacterium]
MRRVAAGAFILMLVFAGAATPDRVPREQAEYTFARVQFNFEVGPGAFNGERQPPWMHDYPRSEDFFLAMVAQVTGVSTNVEAFQVVKLDSEDIFKYPFLYFSEPGFMDLTGEEEKNLREFFNKGGFAMFDDFRGRHLVNLREQMHRVFPDREMVQLNINEPIFTSFYEMKTLDVIPAYQDENNISASFWGMKDEQGRLILIANVANDFGEFWEDIDLGRQALKPAVDSFQFGINYLIYAMTH